MDMAGADPNIEPQKDNENSVNYHPPSMSDWHVNDTNLTNRSVRTITTGNSMGQSSPCSSTPMVDSFCFPTWDQPSNGQSLGYSEALGGMNWNPNAILRGSMFLPNVLPQSLPQFPADLGFIERAARFSCFSGGNLVEMMNSFSSRAPGPIQGPNRPFGDNDLRPLPGIAEVPNEGLIPTEHGTEGSPFKNGKISESFMRTHDEKKNGGDVSGNKPDEAEFIVQEESSGKELGSKKRKKTEQESRNIENDETPKQSDETANDAAEIKQKGDQNLTSTSKPSGKNGKQATQGSDPPKEEYIHVRARRGQATNSHSLAERVRREKISERMKFLQDLVPGCSKVTGKAVMLDEIINYVQSLQRQVEFLSMKLATVNPRLEFNIEGFLKDIPQPRPGLSSSLAFPPDMTAPFPSVHQSQRGGLGLIQAGLTGMGISSEMFQRPVSTLLSGGSKESCSQVPSAWEDELRNIVHMGFNSSTPPNSQDLSGSVPSGHMKAEP